MENGELLKAKEEMMVKMEATRKATRNTLKK
jgi:hypothetical protein